MNELGFTVKGRKMTVSYRHLNEHTFTEGAFEKNADTGELRMIEGSTWFNVDGERGEMVGTWRARENNGSLLYDYPTGITIANLLLLIEATQQIEPYALGTNTSSED